VAKRPNDPDEPSRADKVATTAAEKAKAARIAKIERAVVVVSVVAGLIAASVIWKNHHKSSGGADPTVKALQDVGVTPFVAGCGNEPPTNDLVTFGASANPTASPSADPQATPQTSPAPGDEVLAPGQKFHYPMVPPSAGPHLANPVNVNAGGFYTAADRPPIEGLVANLNAGWTVLWYDAGALGPDQVAKIQKAAGVLHNDKRYATFVASEWDPSYGALPAGTPIALVRWTKTAPPAGHRSFCHESSGEAFLQFMVFYGAPLPPGEQPL
jgi:hypothetical protein